MAENTTLSAESWSAQGVKGKPVSLPSDLFDGTVNMPVMHQAVKAYLANQRQGTASTKTRGFVVGGNQKPWKQKGTGRARQGSTRSPHFVGGGTVFGPRPRSYRETVPKKVRALARKSALNARATEGSVYVVDAFSYEKPRTKDMIALLQALGIADRKVLILTDGAKHEVYMSARNIGNAHVLPYSDVSTYHVLWSDVVVIESGALGTSLDIPEGKSRAAKKSADANDDAGEEAEAAPRARGTKKKTAKKSAAKSAGRKTTGRKTAAKKTTAKKSSSKKSSAKKKSAAKSSGKKKGK